MMDFSPLRTEIYLRRLYIKNNVSFVIKYVILASMDSREKTKEIIKETLIKRGADFVALFGSFARGEEKNTSDIDVLVNFREPISLFDHAGLEIELEEKTGKTVDLVSERGLSKYIRPFIMKELVTLYEGR